jgi:hypothetical protein
MYEDLDKPQAGQDEEAECRCNCTPAKLESEDEAQAVKQGAHYSAKYLNIQG